MSSSKLYKEYPFCNKCCNVIEHICVPREVCNKCKTEINEEHFCKKNIYKCLICEKDFPLLKDLKEHIKTHNEIYNKMNTLNISNTKNAKKYIEDISKGNYPDIEEYIIYKLLHTDSWSRKVVVENLANNTGHQKYMLEYIKTNNPLLLENTSINCDNKGTQTEEPSFVERIYIKNDSKFPLRISKKIVGMVASLNPNIEDYEKWTVCQGKISYSSIFRKLLIYLSEKELDEIDEFIELDDNVFDIIATKLINPILMKSENIVMDFDLKFLKFSNIWSKYVCKTGRNMLSYIDPEELSTFYKQKKFLFNHVNK